MVSPLADQCIQNRKGGNAQQHSRKAEKSAAHHDGHQYPDCRQACTVSQYLGSEYIAVELLQCDDQDSKAQRSPRVHDQQNHHAGHSADDRAKKGDHIGHADDYGDEDIIWNLQNQVKNKAKYADDRTVDELTVDKTHKYIVCLAAHT